jgi:hypothetical protein
MAFATNTDITQYSSDVMDQGVTDWSDQLADAEQDVINLVKTKYWDTHRGAAFDSSLLTDTQWTKTTVFRALSYYILPKLSTFREDDVWLEQVHFYKERFNEELNIQFGVGIEYDSNDDGVVQESEKNEHVQSRLYR